jgi:excinuclease ABC subunit B
MYADELTDSMDRAITETNRRRAIQEEYNKVHGITPQTIRKSVRDTIKATITDDIKSEYDIKPDETLEQVISRLTDEMLKHAKNMEFEQAAKLRDKIKELEKFIEDKQILSSKK